VGIKVNLQKHGENGRHSITIPKAIAESKGYEKGDTFEIEDMGGNTLRLIKK